MAVNKDFVVKNGLEVNRLLIRTNTSTNRVGINTDIINATFEVNGSILSKSLSVLGVTTFSSVNVTNSLQVSGSAGANGQYLRSTGTGVTWANFPSTRTSQTFTAVPGQTLFPFTYTIGLVDVFLNGTKLSSTDFNASSGSSINFNVPCFGGETVEIIGYSASTIGITTTIGIGGITVLEEGSVVGTENGITSIDFVGVAVTAVGSGSSVTVYISDTIGDGNNYWEGTLVGINTTSNVSIGTTESLSELTVFGGAYIDGNAYFAGIATALAFDGSDANITGIITASSYEGSGVNLTGIVTSITAGSGISIDQPTGNVTITATGGGGGESFWAQDFVGIHTTSNVGVATTATQNMFQVDRLGVDIGFGTFVASPGVPIYASTVLNGINLAEYTIMLENDSNIQSQKVLLMRNSTTAYSQQYAIMFEPNQIVSIGATILSNNMLLELIPESGISGIITYKFFRNTLM